VVGAILAGGAGRRMGGQKAARLLAGRPLVAHPAAALGAVCDRVVVVCKSGTELPPGPWEVWDGEPDEPRHPAAGIAWALERAEEGVLVCAADMPFVTADACRTLLQMASQGATAVVATADGVLQPTFGLYAPAALDALRLAPADAPLTATVEALDPARVALPAAVVRSVNTPEELAEAENLLG
jgi:molybdenum cofactor guanylyltransferase